LGRHHQKTRPQTLNLTTSAPQPPAPGGPAFPGEPESMHLQLESHTLYSDPLNPNPLSPKSDRENDRERERENDRGRERERARAREREGERERRPDLRPRAKERSLACVRV